MTKPSLVFTALDNAPALGLNFASAHKSATPQSPDLDGKGTAARENEMLHDFRPCASASRRGAL